MNRTALARLVAMLLAIVSLSMLVAGILGMRSAAKTRRADDTELTDLQNKIDDYRQVSAKLMDGSSYQNMNEALEQQKKDYENDSAHHRTELATYTATNGGLEMGAQAMSQAEAALTVGRTQLESGKQQLEKQAAAFNSLYGIASSARTMLQTALPLLDAADLTLDSAQRLLNSLDRIGSLLELPGGDNLETLRWTTLEAADAALAAYNDALVITELLRDQEISGEMLRETMQSFGIQSGEDLIHVAEESGITLTDEQKEQLAAMLTADTVVPLSTEQIDTIRTEVENSIGMSMEELVEKIQEKRNAVAAGEEDYDFNGEQFGTIRRAYSDNRESIQKFTAVFSLMIPELRSTVASSREQLREAETSLQQIEEAKAAMDEGYAALQTAEEQLVAGETAIAEGNAQLETAREEQKKKAEALDQEKQSLDQMEKELLRATETVEAQKDLEKQEKTLRNSLLARQEIQNRIDAGADLLTASADWLTVLEQQARENYRNRSDAAILMMVGAFLALLAGAAGIGGKGSIPFRILSTMLCQAFSLSSILILYRMGRGVSWSALTCFGLATGELACLLPDLTISKP